MRHSESIATIAGALAKAQSEMKPALKDSDNPHFRSKYADLASLWEACRGPLSENGIAVAQSVESPEDGVSVTTLLLHTSGEWIECGPLVIPLGDKLTAQSVGSGTSYAKRYALAAAVGLTAEDDDDGNKATESPGAKRAEAKRVDASVDAKVNALRKPDAAGDAQAAKARFWTLLGKAAFLGTIVEGTKIDHTIKLETDASAQARRKLVGDLLKIDAENVDPSKMSAGEWDIATRALETRMSGELPLEAV